MIPNPILFYKNTPYCTNIHPIVFIIALPSETILYKSSGFFLYSKELTDKHGMTSSICGPFHTTFLPSMTNLPERSHQISSKGSKSHSGIYYQGVVSHQNPRTALDDRSVYLF
jgi:hypothetical protein